MLGETEESLSAHAARRGAAGRARGEGTVFGAGNQTSRGKMGRERSSGNMAGVSLCQEGGGRRPLDDVEVCQAGGGGRPGNCDP